MTDIEIARNANKKDIREVASSLGLSEKDYILYGNDKAKIIRNYSAQKGK